MYGKLGQHLIKYPKQTVISIPCYVFDSTIHKFIIKGDMSVLNKQFLSIETLFKFKFVYRKIRFRFESHSQESSNANIHKIKLMKLVIVI